MVSGHIGAGMCEYLNIYPTLKWASCRRRHRRLIHNNFHPTAAARLRPRLLMSTRNLLNRFLDKPGDVMGNLR